MKRIIKAAVPVLALAIFLFVLLVVITRAQVIASGGVYTLEKAVVAGGGRDKELAGFSEHGTTGQPVAGWQSNGGSYSVYSGFWTPDDIAPTAAGVVISGRITASNGAGIRNVIVKLTDFSGGVQTAISTSLGYYSFDDVPAGETYLVTVAAKRYTFAVPTRVTHAVDNISDLDFIAEPLQ